MPKTSLCGERLIGLKLQRDGSAKDASDLHRHIASGAPQITPDKDRHGRRPPAGETALRAA
jgi:hypothetical protein